MRVEIGVDLTRGTLAANRSRTFCLPLYYQNYEDQNIENYKFVRSLDGSQTWTVIMREEQRPRAFETTVLEKYLGVRGMVIKLKVPQTCLETISFSRRNLLYGVSVT